MPLGFSNERVFHSGLDFEDCVCHSNFRCGMFAHLCSVICRVMAGAQPNTNSEGNGRGLEMTMLTCFGAAGYATCVHVLGTRKRKENPAFGPPLRVPKVMGAQVLHSRIIQRFKVCMWRKQGHRSIHNLHTMANKEPATRCFRTGVLSKQLIAHFRTSDCLHGAPP